jgi:choline dehydrogenase-like flavoprotein
MGLTAVANVYSPWGKRSVAHYNPATTLTFWRLGKVSGRDAAFYALSQFAGAVVGVLGLALVLRSAYLDPPVVATATRPGPSGAVVAFLAACIRCNTCDGFPCLVKAKADAQTCGVDHALKLPNVTLLTNALVERVTSSPSGREATGVVAKVNGVRTEFSADVVVLSCGAINSAALLLRSANDRHPHGLANSSGVVGRHYMGHTNSVQMALSKCPNPTVFQKTLSVNDYYFGDAEFPFPMGHILFVGKLDAQTLRAGAPRVTPNWTLELMARHSLDFWLTSEDLPDPDNRVTLDSKGGIVLSYKPNNEEGHIRLVAKLKQLIKATTRCTVHGHGCHEGLFARSLWVGQRIPLAGVAHQVGTVRFGTDPRTSALDPGCKAHDLDNLYVVDGSFFVSSGAVNPALTIMANALRVGDRLLDRFK